MPIYSSIFDNIGTKLGQYQMTKPKYQIKLKIPMTKKSNFGI